jgi:hypothetical protein
MLSAMISGLQKREQELAPFVIGSKQYTVAQVIAALQARHDATQAVTMTKAAWQAAVKTDHDGRASGQAFLAGVRQTLLTAYAGSVDSLADFGLVGHKPHATTPEKQVAAAQKAKATRAARHTLGKKQKLALKGDVTGVVVTPVTPPKAAPGAPAQGPASPTPTPGAPPTTAVS